MSYLTTVLGSTPNHYWRLNDPGGLLARDIGSNPLMLVSGITIPMVGYSGIANDGGSFCATSGVTYWAPDPHLLADPFSVELWVFPLSRRNGGAQDLFRWDTFSPPNLTIQYLANGRFEFFFDSSSVTDSTVRAIQAWYHVVGTYSTTNGARLYVNGVQVGTAAAVGAISISAPIRVGEDTGSALTSSNLSEVATYTRELTASEVSAHYAAREVSNAPSFQLPGATSGGAFGSIDADLQQLLAAVIRTFPPA